MGDLFRSGEPLFRSGECLFRSGESRQRKRPGGPPVGHSPALGRCLPTRARAPIAKRLSGGQHASAPSSSANAGNARPRPGGERQRPSLRSGTGSPVDSMDGVDKRPERRRGGDRCRLTTPTTLTTGRADGLSPFPEERPDGEGRTAYRRRGPSLRTAPELAAAPPRSPAPSRRPARMPGGAAVPIGACARTTTTGLTPLQGRRSVSQLSRTLALRGIRHHWAHQLAPSISEPGEASQQRERSEHDSSASAKPAHQRRIRRAHCRRRDACDPASIQPSPSLIRCCATGSTERSARTAARYRLLASSHRQALSQSPRGPLDGGGHHPAAGTRSVPFRYGGGSRARA